MSSNRPSILIFQEFRQGFAGWLEFLAPALVMSGWATVLLHALVSGQIHHLLAPSFRLYVAIAAVVLFLLSLLHLITYEPLPENPAKKSGWAGRVAFWAVLFLPMGWAAAEGPATFSQATLGNRSDGLQDSGYAVESSTSSTPASNNLLLPDSSTGQAATSSTPLTNVPSESSADQDLQAAKAADPNQPAPLEISDLLIIATSPSQVNTFAARRVRLTGILDSWHDQPILVRWMMWCCAADAQPLTVRLTGTWPNTIRPITDPDKPMWVNVIGQLEFTNQAGVPYSQISPQSKAGNLIPHIEVKSVETTEEPDEPFLSP